MTKVSLDALRRYLSGPMRTAEAAEYLGLPGPWTLRRLEKKGLVKPTGRTLAQGKRYYRRDALAEARQRAAEARARRFG